MTALRQVVEACDKQGIARHRIVVSHQCLGIAEWPGTRELVERQAAHYGLRLEISRYRNKDGKYLSLLDCVRLRRRWPDNVNRWCTSNHKRGPGGRVLTKLFRESQGPMLNIFGFRAEESPARAKKKVLARNTRFSSGQREVWDWLPIHEWTEEQVWQDIRQSGVPYHPAYVLGMARLSCILCIFAPRCALILAGRANPELLDAYCEVEAEIGHTFQNGRTISSIRDAIAAGEEPGSMSGAWNM